MAKKYHEVGKPDGGFDGENMSEGAKDKKPGMIKRTASYVGNNWKPMGIGFVFGSIVGSIGTAAAICNSDVFDEDSDDEETDTDVQVTEF